MNVNEILKKIAKGPLSGQLKINKEDLMDVLNHYKKMNVVYIDADENLLILWTLNSWIVSTVLIYVVAAISFILAIHYNYEVW